MRWKASEYLLYTLLPMYIIRYTGTVRAQRANRFAPTQEMNCLISMIRKTTTSILSAAAIRQSHRRWWAVLWVVGPPGHHPWRIIGIDGSGLTAFRHYYSSLIKPHLPTFDERSCTLLRVARQAYPAGFRRWKRSDFCNPKSTRFSGVQKKNPPLSLR